MSEPRADHLSISIEQKLTCLSRAPFKPYIFRVNDRVRSLNEEAYEPEILSIGPCHHGKDKLQMMEGLKLPYLQQLLERTKESSVERYIVALRELKERALQCYGESIDLTDDEFVEMMLLDGCFIIEFFRKFACRNLVDQNDPIFHNLDQIEYALQHDLMLFENQVPFFILYKLFDMTRVSSTPSNLIIVLAFYFLAGTLPGPNISETSNGISVDNVDHLLGLLHSRWCPSLYEIVPKSNPNEVVLSENGDEDEVWEFTKCATELRDAGIKFETPKECTSLFDIKFQKGVLKMPLLIITDITETIFRNQIAYEQRRPLTYSRDVTNYAFFMNRLINSAKDVQKLRHYRVIENCIGDDDAVSTMFNKLCRNVAISHPKQSSYLKVFKRVNKHCGRRRNIWLAKLNRYYFSSPWKIISIFAAVLLLLLTLIQTIFSVLSYFKSM